MKLTGMAQAFEEQLQLTDHDALSFEERLAFLVEREYTLRSNRQLANRLRRAHLKLQATFEDLDRQARRGLDKTLLTELARSRFIHDHLNVLITGPTGVGKTFLACAIAHSACRNGFSACYLRVPRLTSQLPVKQWHEIIGDPTLADAILDRLVHNAYTINMKGESMGKKRANLTQPDHPAQ